MEQYTNPHFYLLQMLFQINEIHLNLQRDLAL